MWACLQKSKKKNTCDVETFMHFNCIDVYYPGCDTMLIVLQGLSWRKPDKCYIRSLLFLTTVCEYIIVS
jgi:hypothetical protein